MKRRTQKKRDRRIDEMGAKLTRRSRDRCDVASGWRWQRIANELAMRWFGPVTVAVPASPCYAVVRFEATGRQTDVAVIP